MAPLDMRPSYDTSAGGEAGRLDQLSKDAFPVLGGEESASRRKSRVMKLKETRARNAAKRQRSCEYTSAEDSDEEETDIKPDPASMRTGPAEGMDEQTFKKKQRMIRNRESAALSRKRKRDRIDSLEKQVAKLMEENRLLRRRLEKYEVAEGSRGQAERWRTAPDVQGQSRAHGARRMTTRRRATGSSGSSGGTTSSGPQPPPAKKLALLNVPATLPGTARSIASSPSPASVKMETSSNESDSHHVHSCNPLSSPIQDPMTTDESGDEAFETRWSGSTPTLVVGCSTHTNNDEGAEVVDMDNCDDLLFNLLAGEGEEDNILSLLGGDDSTRHLPSTLEGDVLVKREIDY